MYSKKVMEYFMHPKNVGEIKNPDSVGKAGNIVCGDIMWIYIKVGNKNGKKIIKDIKFKTLGCAAAIASSSITTELAKGKSIRDALKISNKEIVKSLGGLPPSKVHCSVLAADALKEAIYNYLRKNKLSIPLELEKEHKRIQKELGIAEGRK